MFETDFCQTVGIFYQAKEPMDGWEGILSYFWRQLNMFEIRRAGSVYRIYDKEHKKYLGYTTSEETAQQYIYKVLRDKGFQGNTPGFMYVETEQFGLNLDVATERGENEI